MATGKRTTMRLESDVREFLEKSKRKYEGMDMTAIVHFAVRYIEEEKVLQDFLRSSTPEDAANNSKTETDDTKGDQSDSNMDRQKGPSGGVSFSNVSRTKKEEEPGEDESTRGPDESNSREDESHDDPSENDGKRKQSAASSFRSRFRG